jgi:two-component system sensor histidine kinase BaeS
MRPRGEGGPPWANWEDGSWRRQHRRGRSGRIFLRFAAIFGLLALLLLGGLALFIFLVVRLAGGDQRTATALWLSTCGFLLLFPLLIGWLGTRAFRNIARPLSSLLDGSERVAAGDLSVRVPVGGRNEFAQLTTAFNHMVEELELAEERRRNLTADVAHELRTPLQIIQGNLEGILDGVYAPSTEHIEATLGEARLLARLVEDLRVLSQAEAGQLVMQHEYIEVRELLNDVSTSFSGQAQAAGVTLNVSAAGQGVEPSPVAIQGDYGRMEQVLGNLLANALRHTPPGGSITLCAEEDHGHRVAGGAEQPAGDKRPVLLTVADTGEGIRAEDLPFIFDRFWRGDRSRTHAAGAGSGLGLAIARQLIQLQGGGIEVSSTEGEGTTFTIRMPQA